MTFKSFWHKLFDKVKSSEETLYDVLWPDGKAHIETNNIQHWGYTAAVSVEDEDTFIDDVTELVHYLRQEE